jgi:uncharacterized membrane protein YfcA
VGALARGQGFLAKHQTASTIAMGFFIGLAVTLSSVGAGAIGVTALVLLFPLLATTRIVGTDIAHAVPITLLAGFGHALFGNVNWWLLASLLIGSLPGIWLGSHLTARIPEKVLRFSLVACCSSPARSSSWVTCIATTHTTTPSSPNASRSSATRRRDSSRES